MYPLSQLYLSGRVNPVEPVSLVSSIRDYGAVGDGVIDDAPAINAALLSRYNGGGGVVLVPAGTYLLGAQTIVYPGTWLLGENRGAVTLRSAPSLGATLLRNADLGGVTNDVGTVISNITFDFNGTKQTASNHILLNRTTDFLIDRCAFINLYDTALLYADASSGPFENTRPVLRDCLIDGTGQVVTADLCDFGSSTDARVERVTVQNCINSADGGLSCAYTRGLLITDCTFINNANWAVSIQGAEGARILNSTFRANVGHGGIQLLPWDTTSPYDPLTDTVLSGCHFDSNTIGIHISTDNLSTVDRLRLAHNTFERQVTADIQILSGTNIDIINNATDSAANFIALPNGAIPTLRATGNRGYNPLAGAVTTPVVPASGTGLQNTTGVDVFFLTYNGTVGNIEVSDIAGLNYQFQASNAAIASGIIPAGAFIKIAYTAAPNWAWYGL